MRRQIRALVRRQRDFRHEFRDEQCPDKPQDSGRLVLPGRLNPAGELQQDEHEDEHRGQRGGQIQVLADVAARALARIRVLRELLGGSLGLVGCLVYPRGLVGCPVDPFRLVGLVGCPVEPFARMAVPARHRSVVPAEGVPRPVLIRCRWIYPPMRWLAALIPLILAACSASAPVAPTPTTIPPTSSSLPAPVPTATPRPAPLEARTPTGEYFLGNADAPVTFEMFGDFQCPVCGEFARTEEPVFFQHYVDTGKVRFVWRDYTWIGSESVQAAQAARCAGEQGQFWAYHNYLFNHQYGENVGQFSRTNLVLFAVAVGLDPVAFTPCLDSGKYFAALQDAVSFGVRAGVDVTPAFLINGELKIGAPPLARLEALTDSYLARSAH
jgi:protein-disulfide isomerase